MKTTTPIIIVLSATLFGCSTPSPWREFAGRPPTEIIVTVRCSDSNTRFAGSIVSDGRGKRLSGTGNGSFHATGNNLVCSFRKLDPSGSITISVSEAGESLGNSSTDTAAGGVRAEVLRLGIGGHTIFTTF